MEQNFFFPSTETIVPQKWDGLSLQFFVSVGLCPKLAIAMEIYEQVWNHKKSHIFGQRNIKGHSREPESAVKNCKEGKKMQLIKLVIKIPGSFPSDVPVWI